MQRTGRGTKFTSLQFEAFCEDIEVQITLSDPGSPVVFCEKFGNSHTMLVSFRPCIESERLKNIELIVMIDRSTSMGEKNKIRHVCEARARLIPNLDPSLRINVVSVGDRPQLLHPTAVEPKKIGNQLATMEAD